MADRATSDRVAADMQPPNFRAAVKVIRFSIVKKKAKAAEVNQAISQDWATVTGYKVEKRAGVVFGMLDKLEQPERTDFMRSLNGLIDAAGWDKETQDLADIAEGNVVHLRVGGSSETGGDKDGEDEGSEEEMAEVEAAFDEAKPGRRAKAKEETGGESVKGKAAERKAAVAAAVLGKPTVAKVTSPLEPFTGDNSDLAGDADE